MIHFRTLHCIRQRGLSSRLRTETIDQVPGTWRLFSRALHDYRLTPLFCFCFLFSSSFFNSIFFLSSSVSFLFVTARCLVQSILSCSGITSPPYNLHALGSNGVGTGFPDDLSGSGFPCNPRYWIVVAYIASKWCTLSLVASGWGFLRDQAISHLLDWMSRLSPPTGDQRFACHMGYEEKVKGISIVLNLIGSPFSTRGSGFSLRSNRNPVEGGAPFFGPADP